MLIASRVCRAVKVETAGKSFVQRPFSPFKLEFGWFPYSFYDPSTRHLSVSQILQLMVGHNFPLMLKSTRSSCHLHTLKFQPWYILPLALLEFLLGKVTQYPHSSFFPKFFLDLDLTNVLSPVALLFLASVNPDVEPRLLSLFWFKIQKGKKKKSGFGGTIQKTMGN